MSHLSFTSLAPLSVALSFSFLFACSSSEAPGDGDGDSEVEEPCSDDSDCLDDNACNGVESCQEGICESGEPVECEGDSRCNAESGACVTDCDEDGDGHDAIECGGDDCDDTDANRFPGNAEVCTDSDGNLDDASLTRDEDCDPKTLGDDKDGDGYFRKECGNENSSGQVIFGVDCDDNNDLRRPGLVEVCDGLDNDCLGGLDFPGEDDDHDGYSDCTDLAGSARFDCNDNEPAINPGVELDLCDGIDLDCDGSLEDDDGDSYYAVDATCVGDVARTDCDDTDENISPDGVESCNGVDDDCSGEVDDNGAVLASCGRLRFRAESTCNGACDVSCYEGFGDCDDDPDNGCESNLATNEHCGQCGNSCLWGCDQGRCIEAVDLEVGDSQTCVILDTGSLACWGWNLDGALGINDPDENFVFGAVDVPFSFSLDETIEQVALGDDFGCALMASDEVVCWGNDDYGRLGDGDDDGAAHPLPVQVAGYDGSVEIDQISAGRWHACALLASGKVQCWGHDLYGQVGNGSPDTDDVYTPVDVAVIDGTTVHAESIAAGGFRTCALLSDGSVRCWGRDWRGGLNTDHEHSPVLIGGFAGKKAKQISLGVVGCAIFEDDSLKCWGADGAGAVGDGNDDNQTELSAVDVLGLNGGTYSVVDISTGNAPCALLRTGEVYCWGGNYYGGLGNGLEGDASNAYSPQQVIGLSGVQAVAGNLHNCALMGDGTVKCWGYDSTGQVGDGDDGQANQLTPVDVIRRPPAEETLQTSLGSTHVCSVQGDRSMSCWGYDGTGAVGDGGAMDSLVHEPTSVLNIGAPNAGALETSVGYSGGCALMETGAVKCWGFDISGEIGDGDDDEASEASPVDVVGLDGTTDEAVQITAGHQHRCALLSTGGVKCWGHDSQGQVGDGNDDNLSQHAPIFVVGLDGTDDYALRVSGGEMATCAELASGGVSCWGSSGSGVLGNGMTSGIQYNPGPMTDSADLSGLVIRQSFACGLRAGGGVACWGQDYDGVLGDGDDDGGEALLPQDLPFFGAGDKKAVQLAAGTRHVCARVEDGSIYCWGDNYYGQLGDGTTRTERFAPVRVELINGKGLRAVDISAGGNTTCAVIDTGEQLCWGHDGPGTVGDGEDDSGDEPIPVYVAY